MLMDTIDWGNVAQWAAPFATLFIGFFIGQRYSKKSYELAKFVSTKEEIKRWATCIENVSNAIQHLEDGEFRCDELESCLDECRSIKGDTAILGLDQSKMLYKLIFHIENLIKAFNGFATFNHQRTFAGITTDLDKEKECYKEMQNQINEIKALIGSLLF
jgi:uncharacterized protein YukE